MLRVSRMSERLEPLLALAKLAGSLFEGAGLKSHNIHFAAHLEISDDSPTRPSRLRSKPPNWQMLVARPRRRLVKRESSYLPSVPYAGFWWS